MGRKTKINYKKYDVKKKWGQLMSSNKILLSADSTCDLGKELKEKYNVIYYPFYVIIEDKQYYDGVDITTEEIYKIYYEKNILPKTAASGVGDYMNHFKDWVEQGYEIIHINIGSGLSSSYQNCCLAAKEFNGKVYPIDSCNLSSGTGLIVLEAAKRIAQGLSAKEIQKEVSALVNKVESSFVLDTLKFLHAGGRCSSVAALGANLLKLKPCIEVDSKDGHMAVGKKYRGEFDKILVQYVNDKIKSRTDIQTDNIFIAHSGIDEERINLVKNEIEKIYKFNNINIVKASCTISAHCGPNTLGLLFIRK